MQGSELTVLPLTLYRGKVFAKVFPESKALESQDTLVDPIEVRDHWQEDRPMYLTAYL